MEEEMSALRGRIEEQDAVIERQAAELKRTPAPQPPGGASDELKQLQAALDKATALAEHERQLSAAKDVGLRRQEAELKSARKSLRDAERKLSAEPPAPGGAGEASRLQKTLAEAEQLLEDKSRRIALLQARIANPETSTPDASPRKWAAQATPDNSPARLEHLQREHQTLLGRLSALEAENRHLRSQRLPSVPSEAATFHQAADAEETNQTSYLQTLQTMAATTGGPGLRLLSLLQVPGSGSARDHRRLSGERSRSPGEDGDGVLARLDTGYSSACVSEFELSGRALAPGFDDDADDFELAVPRADPPERSHGHEAAELRAECGRLRQEVAAGMTVECRDGLEADVRRLREELAAAEAARGAAERAAAAAAEGASSERKLSETLRSELNQVSGSLAASRLRGFGAREAAARHEIAARFSQGAAGLALDHADGLQASLRRSLSAAQRQTAEAARLAAELDGDDAALRSECKGLRAAGSELRQAAARGQAETQRLSDALERERSAGDGARSEAAKERQACNSLRSECESLRAAGTELRQAATRAQEAAAAENQRLSDALERERSDVNGARSEAARERQACDALRAQAAGQASALSAAHGELAEARSELARRQEICTELRAELAGQADVLAAAEADLARKHDAKTEARSELAKCRLLCDELRAKATSDTARLAALEAGLAREREDKADAISKLARLQQLYDDATAKVASQTAQLSALQTDLARGREDDAEARSKLTRQQQLYDEVKAKLTGQTAELAALEAELVREREDNAEAQSKLTRQRQLSDEAKAKLASLTTELSAREADLAREREDNAEARSKLTRLQQLHDEAKAKLASQAAEHSAREADLAEAPAQQRLRDEFGAEVARLLEATAALEAERDGLDGELARERDERAAATAEVAARQKLCDNLAAEAARSLAAISALEQQCERLQLEARSAAASPARLHPGRPSPRVSFEEMRGDRGETTPACGNTGLAPSSPPASHGKTAASELPGESGGGEGGALPAAGAEACPNAPCVPRRDLDLQLELVRSLERTLRAQADDAAALRLQKQSAADSSTTAQQATRPVANTPQRGKVAQVEAQLEERHGRIRDLEAELAGVKGKAVAAHEELARARVAAKAAKAELAHANTQLAAFDDAAQAREKQGTPAAAKRKPEPAESTVAALRRENWDLKERLRDACKDANASKQAADDARLQAQGLVKAMVSTKGSNISDLKEKIRILATETPELQKRLQVTSEALHDAQAELWYWRATAGNWKRKCEILDSSQEAVSPRPPRDRADAQRSSPPKGRGEALRWTPVLSNGDKSSLRTASPEENDRSDTPRLTPAAADDRKTALHWTPSVANTGGTTLASTPADASDRRDPPLSTQAGANGRQDALLPAAPGGVNDGVDGARSLATNPRRTPADAAGGSYASSSRISPPRGAPSSPDGGVPRTPPPPSQAEQGSAWQPFRLSFSHATPKPPRTPQTASLRSAPGVYEYQHQSLGVHPQGADHGPPRGGEDQDAIAAEQLAGFFAELLDRLATITRQLLLREPPDAPPAGAPAVQRPFSPFGPPPGGGGGSSGADFAAVFGHVDRLQTVLERLLDKVDHLRAASVENIRLAAEIGVLRAQVDSWREQASKTQHGNGLVTEEHKNLRRAHGSLMQQYEKLREAHDELVLEHQKEGPRLRNGRELVAAKARADGLERELNECRTELDAARRLNSDRLSLHRPDRAEPPGRNPSPTSLDVSPVGRDSPPPDADGLYAQAEPVTAPSLRDGVGDVAALSEQLRKAETDNLKKACMLRDVKRLAQQKIQALEAETAAHREKRKSHEAELALARAAEERYRASCEQLHTELRARAKSQTALMHELRLLRDERDATNAAKPFVGAFPDGSATDASVLQTLLRPQ
ncbi:hypothetical protein DIPPA_35847 [Diplonema papillatum]|nr:hypothetical protein DIPPA_35847 [Diplonema papillatum]